MYILKYSDYLVPIHNPVNKPTTQCTYHHIQCTLQHTATLCNLQLSIHCIFSEHTTAAIASSVRILQQPLHLQCTYYSSHCIFSAHCNHVQPSAANLQCTLQLTAAIYNNLHYNYTIQCTLQLHYLMLIPYSASSEEG